MKSQPRFHHRNHRFPVIAHCHGQATAEFLALAAVLIPLFVLLPYIARYQDINHSSQMAARYVAFDAIIHNDTTSAGWKPKTELDQEVQRRFFSEPGAPIKHNDAAGDFRAHHNPFWHDPKNDPLIRNFSDISVGFIYSSNNEDGFSNKRLASSSDGAPFILSNMAGTGEKSFKLKARGIYSAGVTVTLANLPDDLNFYKPFDELNLKMTRSASLLIDHWAASSPGDVVERIKQSPEAYPATTMSDVADGANALIQVIEWGQVKPVQFGKLDDWRDVVPRDRLKGEGRGQPR